MLKKFPSDKIRGTKNFLFFLTRAPTHHSFTFYLWFSYELKQKVSLELRVGFSILDSVLFLFLHGLFDFKTS